MGRCLPYGAKVPSLFRRAPDQARRRSFLKRHAHAVGVNCPELFRAPGLGLQCSVGVHFSPAFLVFGIHGRNALNGNSHYGLVPDLARQFFVAHAGYVQVGLAAIDSYVGRRRGVAKGCREAADLCPPMEGLRCVSGGKNGDRAFYDRVHGRSIIELTSIAYNCQVRVVGQFPVTAFYLGTDRLRRNWCSPTLSRICEAPGHHMLTFAPGRPRVIVVSVRRGVKL